MTKLTTNLKMFLSTTKKIKKIIAHLKITNTKDSEMYLHSQTNMKTRKTEIIGLLTGFYFDLMYVCSNISRAGHNLKAVQQNRQ